MFRNVDLNDSVEKFNKKADNFFSELFTFFAGLFKEKLLYHRSPLS